jgi:L-histidine N-alpha-methyltransferase
VIDEALRAQVRKGLASRPPRLPFALFYDDLGSALFEAITCLPEYGLTRADVRLLTRHAAEAVALLEGPIEIAELGPGSGGKAEIVVRAARGVQDHVRFFAIDVSKAALDACRVRLESIPIEVVPLEAGYLEGLRDAAQRRNGRPLLALFLGSNIGNLDRSDAQIFLESVRGALRPGDGLLLSADLVKDPRLLELAYDDALGVTAAFDRNVLARMNRELGADFDLASFRHRATWNAAERRVEMHLEALTRQRVRIEGLELDLDLAAGTSIWSESSHKFTADEIVALGSGAGFACRSQWTDAEWPFTLNLFVAR